MRNIIFTLTMSVLLTSSLNAQIIADFENASPDATTFMTGAVEWQITGDFLISEFEDFSCTGLLGTNRYIDSGYLNGGSEGIVGSIAPTDAAVSFQMATSTSQCVWLGSADGQFISTGTIKFTGQKTDDTTVEESFELTTTSYNDLVAVDFSASIWSAVDLSSLQVEITGTQDSTNYVAIDNLTFDAITVPTSIQEVDALAIKLFPNPTSGRITMQHIDASQIEVYDRLGQLVLHTFDAKNSINLESLPAGVYIVKIREAEQLFVEKVVKR
ncbi:MAG: T9SS type A sorting domain-containing protein [Bacteroidota bacterium]